MWDHDRALVIGLRPPEFAENYSTWYLNQCQHTQLQAFQCSACYVALWDEFADHTSIWLAEYQQETVSKLE